MPTTTVLGFDTATAATVVGVLSGDTVVEHRDDPPTGTRPGHATRLLGLVDAALNEAGIGWEQIDRVAVGVGPGSFTGLRIGVATARALAQARGLPIAPVSTLRALAAGVPASASASADAGADAGRGAHHPIAAVIDARRGEVFAGAWDGDTTLVEQAALTPEALASRLSVTIGSPVAVGDGALRFREVLEAAGVTVPPDDASLHRVSAAQVCRLGAAVAVLDADEVLPDYHRRPDAEIPRPRR